ncbi:MAG: RNA signal recognition particle [Rhodobacterales bacterium]|nr:MAG: RNA signal recognition particle [Rhodobacterales bacterium]
MSYYFGSMAAVPTANKAAYLEHCRAAWPLLRKYGALRLFENWGAFIPDGEVTDMNRAVQAKPDETVVLSWIEWPDRATGEAAMAQMETDPDAAVLADMPFDGKRMIFGGFEPLFDSAQEG